MVNMVMPSDKNFTKRPLFLYGAGRICRDFVKACHFIGINPDYICDQNPSLWGQYIELPGGDKLKIISPEEMKSYGLDNPVIITTVFLHSAIASLQHHSFYNIWASPAYGTGAVNEPIINDHMRTISYVLERLNDERSRQVYIGIIKFRLTGELEIIENIYDKDQYFPYDIIKLSDNEVFVDGGAWDGGTIYDFINRVNGNFEHIYSFEPLPEMAQKIRGKFIKHATKDRISIVEKAISDKNEIVYLSLGGLGSTVRDLGNGFIKIEIKTEFLDNFFKDKEFKPTYIKLDIEGVEMPALKGAENIIAKYKPKLAVAIYHKFEDLWGLPHYLMTRYPFYNFYLRHHLIGVHETILYAMPRV